MLRPVGLDGHETKFSYEVPLPSIKETLRFKHRAQLCVEVARQRDEERWKPFARPGGDEPEAAIAYVESLQHVDMFRADEINDRVQRCEGRLSIQEWALEVLTGLTVDKLPHDTQDYIKFDHSVNIDGEIESLFYLLPVTGEGPMLRYTEAGQILYDIEQRLAMRVVNCGSAKNAGYNGFCSSSINARMECGIKRRRWLLLDFDPARFAGISTTDAEHAAAHARARYCRDMLRNIGWPEPIYADSSNGAHLLYCIDLPNNQHSTELVKCVLEAIAARASDEMVKVDTGVYNAARIVKLYGTLTCKGDNTPERLHRRSGLLEVPKVLEVVPADLLLALAAETVPQ